MGCVLRVATIMPQTWVTVARKHQVSIKQNPSQYFQVAHHLEGGPIQNCLKGLYECTIKDFMYACYSFCERHVISTIIKYVFSQKQLTKRPGMAKSS